MESFEEWAEAHVHTAQSTQNIGTGADRVERILQRIKDDGDIHLFGTSAAGAAILEYFVRCAPQTLYRHSLRPAAAARAPPEYVIHPTSRVSPASDAPTDWVPLRRATGGPGDNGPGTLRPLPGQDYAHQGRARRARQRGDHTHRERARHLDRRARHRGPGLYDGDPHFDALPPFDLKRHMYTGSHMSHETRPSWSASGSSRRRPPRRFHSPGGICIAFRPRLPYNMPWRST